MSEINIRSNGFMDYEIEHASLFRQYETADMLPVTVSQKTGVAVITVKKLQKIYRENAGTEAMRMEMRAGVIA